MPLSPYDRYVAQRLKTKNGHPSYRAHTLAVWNEGECDAHPYAEIIDAIPCSLEYGGITIQGLCAQFEAGGVIFKPTHHLNPSICLFNNKTFMAYRTEQRSGPKNEFFQHSAVHLCELNTDHEPINSRLLLLPVECEAGSFPLGTKTEDPRLWVNCLGELHVLYGDGYAMYDACIDESGHVSNVRLFAFDMLPKQQRVLRGEDAREKNWVFFTGHACDYAIYDIRENEMVVLEFEPHATTPTRVWRTPCHIPELWRWFLSVDGTLRGGTPPVVVPGTDDLITIFHTVVKYGNCVCYTAGALRFSSTPPFTVKGVSAQPIWRGRLWPPEIDRPNNSAVIFPAGAVWCADGLCVSFGVNDTQCQLDIIPHAALKV